MFIISFLTQKHWGTLAFLLVCGCISTVSYKLNDKNVHNIQEVEHFHHAPLSQAMKAHVQDESSHFLPTIIGRHTVASFSSSLLSVSLKNLNLKS